MLIDISIQKYEDLKYIIQEINLVHLFPNVFQQKRTKVQKDLQLSNRKIIPIHCNIKFYIVKNY